MLITACLPSVSICDVSCAHGQLQRLMTDMESVSRITIAV